VGGAPLEVVRRYVDNQKAAGQVDLHNRWRHGHRGGASDLVFTTGPSEVVWSRPGCSFDANGVSGRAGSRAKPFCYTGAGRRAGAWQA
jgi:hypothetical protein